MAYSAVSVPADGNVLPASVLQGLQDNAAYLYSVVSGVNIPFTGETLTGSPTTESSRTWVFRHQGRYLHYLCTLRSNDTAEFWIYIDGVAAFNDATNRSATYEYTGAIDLTGLGSPPALGDFIEVVVTVEWDVGGELTVDYLIESDSATL